MESTLTLNGFPEMRTRRKTFSVGKQIRMTVGPLMMAYFFMTTKTPGNTSGHPGWCMTKTFASLWPILEATSGQRQPLVYSSNASPTLKNCRKCSARPAILWNIYQGYAYRPTLWKSKTGPLTHRNQEKHYLQGFQQQGQGLQMEANCSCRHICSICHGPHPKRNVVQKEKIHPPPQAEYDNQ